MATSEARLQDVSAPASPLDDERLPEAARFYNFPALSFHYGIGPVELADLPNWLLAMYRDALPAILAAQHLEAMEAAAWPYMKEADAERVHRHAMRRADEWPPAEYRRAAERNRALRMRSEGPERAAGMAAAVGIGMTFVDADGNPVEVPGA